MAIHNNDTIFLDSCYLAPELGVNDSALAKSVQKITSGAHGLPDEFVSQNFFYGACKKNGRENLFYSMAKEAFEALMELYTDEKSRRVKKAYPNHFEVFKEPKTAKEILERKSPELFAALSTLCPGKDCNHYDAEMEMIFNIAHPVAEMKYHAVLKRYDQEFPGLK